MVRLWVPIFVAAATITNAAVTVYQIIDQSSQATATTSADAAGYTGSAAYDPTVLAPPAPPEQFNRDFVVLVSVCLWMSTGLI